MSNALLEMAGAARAESANPFTARLGRRRVYHAAPLHYLPSILSMRRLVSARIGQSMAIAPRVSAARRDRMLGVDEYVHLAFDLFTPLLADKLERGMPHVVLAFDAGHIYARQPSTCALLPCNTKAFRSRAGCTPECGEQEMAALLKARDEFRRHPSLELLVRGSLSLDALVEMTAFSEGDAALARALLHALAPDMAMLLVERHAPNYVQQAITETQNYCRACIEAACALPPPRIEFD